MRHGLSGFQAALRIGCLAACCALALPVAAQTSVLIHPGDQVGVFNAWRADGKGKHLGMAGQDSVASRAAMKAGYTNVHWFRAGYPAWRDSGRKTAVGGAAEAGKNA